ncbi:MAG: helix-turn-helix domain-containing protein [Chloroflexota bacterium]
MPSDRRAAAEAGFMYYVDRAPMTLAPQRPVGAAAYELPPLEGLLTGVSCRVLSAGWFPCAPGWRLDRRVMPHHIVFVCVGGMAEFRVGGEPYRLTPGSVLLMPPDVPQEGRHVPTEPPMEVYSLHFTALVYGVLDVPTLLGLPIMLRLSPKSADTVVGAAERIIEELAARAPGYALAANGECMRLLTALWREHLSQGGRPSDGEATPPSQVARLAPVFQLIQARYAEGLTLQRMADVLHLHPAYFSTLFKQITGWPPSRFLARYRLDRARELLVSTDRPVHEIAAITGYGEPSHLRRELRRREGLAPRDYRRAKKTLALP